MDFHQGSLGDAFKEIHHVVVVQADATMTGRAPNPIFLIGAMKIDVTIACVRIMRVESLQPENPGEDEILLPSGPRENAGGQTSLEDHPDGFSLTNFLADSKISGRRAKASIAVSQAEFRGGNRVGTKNFSRPGMEIALLTGNEYHDFGRG